MTTACLIASEYNSSQFSWAKATRTFTAFASDLGWKPGSFARHINLVSQKTGQKRLFSLRKTLRTRDGVTAWCFEGADDLRILVHND